MILLGQIRRFLIVGGLAFLLDYGILWAMVEAIGAHYLLAGTVSFTASVIFNYILTTTWVFRDTKQPLSVRSFTVFCGLNAVGLLLNLGIMWLYVDALCGNYLVGKVISTALVMIYNFISRKHIYESAASRSHATNPSPTRGQ